MKKSKSIIKWLLLLLDIVVITLLILVCFHQKDNADDSAKQDSGTETSAETSIVTYKKFTFEIPKNVTYSEIDDYAFKLKNDNCEVVVEPFIHKENGVLKYPNEYRDLLITKGVNISNVQNIKIGIIDVVKYIITHENENETPFYYFNYNDDFDYEVEILAGEENIGQIMNILLTAKFDYDSDQKYEFRYFDYTNDMNETVN